MSRIVTLLAISLAGATCLSQQPPAAEPTPTVLGQVEHEGYGLVGSRGRFYVFGGIAMADYSDSAGARRIVTLQLEDQIQDDNHVYYRELREGHRWAFSRQPGTDGMHGVWVQLLASDSASQPRWQPFQRARKEEPREPGTPLPSASTNSGGAAITCCGR